MVSVKANMEMGPILKCGGEDGIEIDPVAALEGMNSWCNHEMLIHYDGIVIIERMFIAAT